MKGNKIKGTLLIAVFILSTLAMAIPFAIAKPLTIVLGASTGNVGDIIEISGTANASVPLDIFWDYVKIAETSADGAGAYSKNITIPEDVNGTHIVSVKDTFHNYIVEDSFDIEPKITVTPSSGLPLDPFTVAGTGFAAESDIAISFNSTACILTTKGTATAKWTTEKASNGSYSVKLTAGGTWDDCSEVKVYYGKALSTVGDEGFSYYYSKLEQNTWGVLYLDTDDDGIVDRALVSARQATSINDEAWHETDAASTSGSVWGWRESSLYDQSELSNTYHQLSEWRNLFSSVYGVAEIVYAAVGWGGTYLAPKSVYIDDFTIGGVTYCLEQPVEDETDVLGSFEATMTVPAGIEYAVYIVSAFDASGNFNITNFEVTATITMTPDEGACGTVVDISGIGFNGTKVEIYFADILLKKDVAITDGIFTSDFIVPTVAIGEHNVIAIDEDDIQAYLKFNVTETTQITLDPTSTEPDTLVTIEGTGFTATAGVEVDVDLGPLMDYLTFNTNSTGGFKETFLVPTFIPEEYTINATDVNGLTAEANLTIAITELTLDPEEGPTGMSITVTGSGFTLGSLFNVTFNDEIVKAGTTTGTGSLSESFVVPTVPVGFYTVKVVDAAKISGTATFEVNATTTITVTPSAALVDYTIDVEGEYFSANSVMTIVLQNSTWSDTLDTLPISVETDTEGIFSCNFSVIDVDLGNYVVNATDDEGLFALVPFTVVESIYVDVTTSSPEYLPGETVSFYVVAAFAFDLELVITDSLDRPFTTIGPILKADWVVQGDYYVIPYADATFELPSDATPGLWNYTAYDVVEEEMVDTGLFTVSGEVPEPPELPAETTGEETLDPTGAPKTSFALGETVLASADVTNIGTASQMMLIVVQLTDPQLRVLPPNYMSMIVPTGLTITPSMSFVLPLTGYTTGTWTAKIMVLDAWPAMGGVPIGSPVTVTFTVS